MNPTRSPWGPAMEGLPLCLLCGGSSHDPWSMTTVIACAGWVESGKRSPKHKLRRLPTEVEKQRNLFCPNKPPKRSLGGIFGNSACTR